MPSTEISTGNRSWHIVYFEILLSLSQIFGFTMVILSGYFLNMVGDGIKWTNGNENFHGFFMTIGLVFFQGEALLSYRLYRHDIKLLPKLIHVLFHTLAIGLFVTALVAIIQKKTVRAKYPGNNSNLFLLNAKNQIKNPRVIIGHIHSKQFPIYFYLVCHNLKIKTTTMVRIKYYKPRHHALIFGITPVLKNIRFYIIFPANNKNNEEKWLRLTPKLYLLHYHITGIICDGCYKQISRVWSWPVETYIQYLRQSTVWYALDLFFALIMDSQRATYDWLFKCTFHYKKRIYQRRDTFGLRSSAAGDALVGTYFRRPREYQCCVKFPHTNQGRVSYLACCQPRCFNLPLCCYLKCVTSLIVIRICVFSFFVGRKLMVYKLMFYMLHIFGISAVTHADGIAKITVFTKSGYIDYRYLVYSFV
uniref:Cytochrome b561 domain-containing protein n=1 Tax=Heterorhabditis bacteriophora TaxID=37862 RepID=A0A1I7WCH1_HETBA